MVVIGFWPSYFSRLFSARSEPLTVLVHVHGPLMTAWIAIFIVQVSLVTAGRVDLHRRLGVVGFALLGLILIVAVPTTIVATKLGGHHVPGPALPGLALVIAAFAEFVTLGSLGFPGTRVISISAYWFWRPSRPRMLAWPAFPLISWTVL